jgi:hypothetical protein
MPRKVDKIFIEQLLNPKGRGSNPPEPPGILGPSRCFGSPMMNPSRPPLPLNKPYHRPRNYLEYVKDSDPKVHVRIFKASIRINGEIEDVEIVNLFSFTLKDIVFNWCNNYMGDYPNCTFAKL